LLETVDAGSEIEEMRRDYLATQLLALATRVRMLQGDRLTFDEESRLLYGAVAPELEAEYFESVLRELDEQLPGEGEVAARYNSFRDEFVIPPDRLDTVFRRAVEECRAKTAEWIDLPDGESFTIEYVTDKSWSGYNWYQGGYRSLIQVNTDLPIFIDRAIDLACHEGYPGHHVYNVMLEKNMVRDRRWIEFSVYPLYSPQSLIAEGTANYGIEMAFPDDERVEFERNELFELAGIEPSRAERYYEIQELVERLSYAGNEAARRYLNGEIDRGAAIDWLERYALMSEERARQRTRFMDTYRSYVINYNLGEDLVARFVEESADDRAEKWQVFERILSTPTLPNDLVKER
ncbi:MAG: hypothetical protein R3338_05180, partial [Thermoanaerobaculia bacterium]|nr:hypothetical protein [Thermoanaerobaculia bacterium]